MADSKGKTKVLVMPDAFKGSLSAVRFCQIVSRVIKAIAPEYEVVSLPMADGGEGTVEALFHCLGGDLIEKEVTGPYWGNQVLAKYGMKDDLAYIEMACAAGLPLVGEDRRVLETTTYGVGELIADAIGRGAKRILVGLGGSATNDMGCGCAMALGAKFYDEKGRCFLPTGGTLKDVHSLDLSDLYEQIEGVEVTGLCDIDNPLFGENGAAKVFAPQKGASESEVILLEEGLVKLSLLLETLQEIKAGTPLHGIKGAGSAGGFGAGLVFFLKGRLRSGTDFILDEICLEALLPKTKFIFSGEGFLDEQSLSGKTVVGISRRASACQTPVIALVGGYERHLMAAFQREGITAVFALSSKPQSRVEAMEGVEDQLAVVTEQVMLLIQQMTTR